MRDTRAQVAEVTQVSVPPTVSSRFDRRLNDKILAAFSHAYAAGEFERAMRLRQILEDVVDSMRAPTHERRRGCPLERAGLWIDFVDARDRYRTACAANPGAGDAEKTAFEAMKSCYQRWCAA